jgi:hypothetical protein
VLGFRGTVAEVPIRVTGAGVSLVRAVAVGFEGAKIAVRK